MKSKRKRKGRLEKTNRFDFIVNIYFSAWRSCFPNSVWIIPVWKSSRFRTNLKSPRSNSSTTCWKISEQAKKSQKMVKSYSDIWLFHCLFLPECKVTEAEIAALQDKTYRQLRIRELLLENSSDANLIVMWVTVRLRKSWKLIVTLQVFANAKER